MEHRHSEGGAQVAYAATRVPREGVVLSGRYGPTADWKDGEPPRAPVGSRLVVCYAPATMPQARAMLLQIPITPLVVVSFASTTRCPVAGYPGMLLTRTAGPFNFNSDRGPLVCYASAMRCPALTGSVNSGVSTQCRLLPPPPLHSQVPPSSYRLRPSYAPPTAYLLRPYYAPATSYLLRSSYAPPTSYLLHPSYASYLSTPMRLLRHAPY